MNHQVISPDAMGLDPEDLSALRTDLLAQRRFHLASLRELLAADTDARARSQADANADTSAQANAGASANDDARTDTGARTDGDFGASGGIGSGTGARAGADTSAGTKNEAAHARRTASARMMLTDVEAALVRIDEGRYGTCQGCADPIPRAHLAVVPHARYCGRCRRRKGARR